MHQNFKNKLTVFKDTLRHTKLRHTQSICTFLYPDMGCKLSNDLKFVNFCYHPFHLCILYSVQTIKIKIKLD